jgi:hypothetical protein
VGLWVCACSRGSISPSGIVHRLPVIGRRLRLGRQEDAHEFLRLLLDSFQKAELRILGVKESGPRAVVDSTFVHQMFGGYFRNQLKWVPSSVCAQCVCLCVRVCLYVHVWCGHWDDATHSQHGCVDAPWQCLWRRCKVCGHCSNNFDSFLDVSVEIPSHATTLKDLFDHFTVGGGELAVQ